MRVTPYIYKVEVLNACALLLLTAKNTPANPNPAAAAFIPHSDIVGIGFSPPPVSVMNLNTAPFPGIIIDENAESPRRNVKHMRDFVWILVIVAALVLAALGWKWAPRLYNYYTAEERILEVPAFAEIKEFYPELYNQILTDTRAAILRGGKRDEIIADNGPGLAALLQNDLPLASPEATSAFITSFIHVFEKAGGTDPACCVDLINGDDRCMWSLMSPAEKDEVLRAIALIIRSAHTEPAKLTNVKQAKKDVGRISSDVVAKYGPELDYTAQTELTDEEKKKVCFAIADLYSGTLNLPPERSSDAIKYLLSGTGEQSSK